MAHELSIRADGIAEMAWVGDTPWHQLGQELQRGAPIETWLEKAGMDWEILRTAVEYKIPTDSIDVPFEYQLFTDKHVLYRSDTLKPLSVVSPSYNIVQPEEVLEFYRDLVGLADMQLETAGVLFGGKRFWALANTGRMAELKGNDAIKGYLLLSTSCDGTMATSAQFTSIRVVCNNTLSIATHDNNGKIRVPHNRIWNPTEIKRELGLIDESWGKFKEQITLLSETPVERDKAADFLVKLFGDIAVPVDQQSPAVAAKCAMVWDLYTERGKGAELASSKGTVWGLVNAVTQTIDYHTQHRTVDARLNNAWFGAGNSKKSEAFEMGLEMVHG